MMECDFDYEGDDNDDGDDGDDDDDDDDDGDDDADSDKTMACVVLSVLLCSEPQQTSPRKRPSAPLCPIEQTMCRCFHFG